MIRVMKQSRTRQAFPLDVFVRSNPRCKQALDETLASIRGSDRLRLSSQRFSQEALVNALWLWARKKIDNEGVEVLEDELLPHVETLNAMLESAERAAPQGGRQIPPIQVSRPGVSHPSQNPSQPARKSRRSSG